MGPRTSTGFTVIEVMLFLGVTGMLTIGLLVGAGISIGQQRYRDSVNSLKSFLQDQYANTTNVVNARDATWACDSLAGVSENAAGGQARGTSDCVLLGRLVTIDDTGTKLTASNVVGYRTTTAPGAANDLLELQTNYKLGVSPIDQDASQVSWGAQIVKPKTTTPAPLSILIIRSPLSGSTLTFTADGPVANLTDIMTTDNLKTTRDLCVNAEVGTFVGSRLEVQISAFASNQGAVQIPVESASVCN